MPEPSWQKSSFSTDQANCVELAASSAGLHLRESDEPDAAIAATRGSLRSLLRRIQSGEFDQTS